MQVAPEALAAQAPREALVKAEPTRHILIL